jgi:hypothetical protein
MALMEMALTRLVDRGYTTPAMRILISLVLAAIVLTLPLTVTAAPTLQGNVDIKTLALVKADLQRGFEMVPDRTVSEDRPDGVAVYDVTFARERTPENLASGPFEVRSGVARTAQVEDAILQLESTKEAFLAEGWADTGVPALGDEAVGLTQTTDGDGGKIAHFSYLFRKGSYIVMIGVRGRPEAIKLSDAVGLAIIVSGRLDKALTGGGSAAPAGPQSGPTTGSTTRQNPTGERVKVIGADGGSVNMRAEPSTTAEAVSQVSEGTALDIVGPNRDGDGRTWRNVKTGDKSGWIASNFLETVTQAPPPPPAAPSPSPAPPRPAAAAPPAADPPAADAPAEDSDTAPGAPVSGNPAPGNSAATPPPAPAVQNDLSFRGTGNGLVVEATMLSKKLSGGQQQVKIRVTRNGGGVSGAFIDVTARLDAKRYRSIKVDRTNDDGFTEVTWDMEGPAGDYELIVDARTDETGPATSAKSTFRWK